MEVGAERVELMPTWIGGSVESSITNDYSQGQLRGH